MLVKEAQFALATFSRLMEEKMKEPIFHIKGWVNVWISIAVARLYYWMICIAQVPRPLWTQDPDQESGLVLGFEQ